MQGDVANSSDVKRIFAEANKAFGKLDILVNNAGVYQFAPLAEITEEQFHRQFNTNVLGLILASQEAARHFGAEGGTIINIGSRCEPVGAADIDGIHRYERRSRCGNACAAKELGSKKIRVNSINPGMVETEERIPPGLSEARSKHSLKRRLRLAASPKERISLLSPCFWHPRTRDG